jgi:hypothetical protein
VHVEVHARALVYVRAHRTISCQCTGKDPNADKQKKTDAPAEAAKAAPAKGGGKKKK